MYVLSKIVEEGMKIVQEKPIIWILPWNHLMFFKYRQWILKNLNVILVHLWFIQRSLIYSCWSMATLLCLHRNTELITGLETWFILVLEISARYIRMLKWPKGEKFKTLERWKNNDHYWCTYWMKADRKNDTKRWIANHAKCWNRIDLCFNYHHHHHLLESRGKSLVW